MRFRSLLALAITAALSGCGGSEGSTTPVRTVAKVVISGSNTALDPGQTTQLTAVATDAAGATITNPGLVIWTSGTPAVATVDQGGRVTAVSSGSSTISADAEGVKGSFLVRVNLTGGASKGN